MMNRLVTLLFAVCVIYSVQGSVDKLLKIKREALLSSRLSQGEKDHDAFDIIRRAMFTVERDVHQKVAISFLTTGVDAQFSDKWRATDAETNEVFVINSKKKYRPKVNTKDTRAVCIIKRKGQRNTDIKAYIETLVVLDKTVRDQFDSDSEAEKYVEVLLMLSSNAYKHESLTQHGLKIDIVPSEIVILKHEVKFDISKKRDNLYTACDVMNKQEKVIGSKKFDHKLFLTRNQFGAAGFARRETMCSRYSSCSIVFDHGFHAAYMVAHEIGHSLGLLDGNFPQYSRYIMNGIVDSLFNSHRWSTESQRTMLSNIRKYDYCLGNEASAENNYPYPGEYFSFEKQCELEFNATYTAWKPSRWE
ncbi:A disintegrin and metallo ase with thrombospondin motifs 2-like isoform X2, partial [Paramuricea clavata]